MTKRKSSLSLIDLWRGNTQIRKDQVPRFMTDLLPQLREMTEVSLDKENPFLRQSLSRLLKGDRITINPYQATIRRCSLKDFHRVTCPAQGQVQKMFSRCRGQRIEDLVKENGDMPGQPGRP